MKWNVLWCNRRKLSSETQNIIQSELGDTASHLAGNMAYQADIYFKSQIFNDIKSKCLKERQLFIDPLFNSEIALGNNDTVESEPEKNLSVNLEEQCRDKSTENEENTEPSSTVRRVPR